MFAIPIMTLLNLTLFSCEQCLLLSLFIVYIQYLLNLSSRNTLLQPSLSFFLTDFGYISK